MKTDPKRPLPTIRESLVRFARAALLLRPYWPSYTRLLALGGVMAGLGLLAPLFTKLLVDRVYTTRSTDLLGLVVLALLVHHLASSGMGALRGWYGQRVEAHLRADTTVFLANHLQHLPLRFFERMPVGDLLSRFGAVRSALGSVAALFDLVFLRGAFLLLVPPLLLLMNWRLTLVALAPLPLTSAINVAVARVLRAGWRRAAEANAEVQALNVETLSHIRLFKGMGLERENLRRIHGAASEARSESLRVAGYSVGLGSGLSVIRMLGTLCFTYFGWSLILDGTLSLGSFLAFSAYLGMVQGPLDQVTSSLSRFQQTAVTLDRVFEILDQHPEADPALVLAPSYDPPPIPFDGAVRIEKLVFHYVGGPFTLEIPELSVAAGSVTGLVGESGCGKSTLLRLIAGMERPDCGVIFYGNHAHKSIELASIRRSVAFAGQAPELLRGSLRSNLTLGLDDLPEGRLWEIVRVCQLQDLVKELPDGLDSPVAEWGATLSGGQQQRISLARALIREVPLVLLDEVTSNLDSATEEVLLREVFEYLRGRTVVLSTHRPSALRHVDHVVRLAGGRPVLDRELPSQPRALAPTVFASGDPQK